MSSLIPIEYYSKTFYCLTFLGILISYFKLRSSSKLASSTTIHLLLVFALIFYIGLRPISGIYFGDTGAYSRYFEFYKYGYIGSFELDPGFDWFMKKTSRFLSIEWFFLVLAFIYVFAHYWASKRLFNKHWYYAFLIMVTSFSFWSYGTNGIRNGSAAALVLLAFSFEKKKAVGIAIAIVAVSFHRAMLLPVLAYALTFVNNNPKYYFSMWLLCIPASLIFGGAFEILFASIGLEDQRLSYLTEGNVNDDNFSSIGFRWDFLLYSASAVFAGYYFIIRKQFKDALYQRLFNVYLISNGFWILVIRANFSNRFAYLSWFMMGLVIIYPLLKGNLLKNQNQTLAYVLLVYSLFTIVLNVLLVN